MAKLKIIFQLLLAGILWVLCQVTFAQSTSGFTITGTVQDSITKAAVPYATVVIRSNEEEHQVLKGVITDDNGVFTIPSKTKEVYLEISFMGYKTKAVKNLTFEEGKCNAGTVMLASDSKDLDAVVVRAEKSSVEFKLDKKVFNVGQDIVSSGASATDVLNNVPSVNVDIEGNITLRGNSGVQMLINGKPSVLSDEGSNALGSITSDMIESVEVITNPSAKYEAGGTAGIINIVLKKDEKKGLNGSGSLNTGWPHNHSAGVSLNYRTDKFNVFTQFGSGYRSIPTETESINRNEITGESVESTGKEYRNEQFHNITLGTDYYINKLNVVTLSGNFAYEIEQQPSETEFIRTDTTENVVSEWLRTESTAATNPKYQYDLQYKREFKNHKDHVLLMSTLGKFFGKDLTSEFYNESLVGTEVRPSQQTSTDFYRADYIWKLDYTNPVPKSEKLSYEAGAQYQINDVGNDYAVSNLENSFWVADSSFTNDFEYVQKVLGAYGTGSYEGEKFGLKLGLRSEYTDLSTLLVTTNESNRQEYVNLFPSVHSSYKITKFVSVQGGYSRRIYRPSLWELNPFFNIRNNFNIRTGNPNLLPEYADSYEVTGILVFEKFYINSSVYYLYKTNLINRVSTTENNITYTMPMNVGTMGKLGIEANVKYDPVKWFSVRADFNYGVFDMKGSFNDQNFDFSGDQWTGKINARFKLPKNFDLETTTNIESSYKTIQGTRSGFVFFNAGLRKKIKDGKFVINGNVRDLFASRIRETESYVGDYYLYNFSRRGRFLTLGISYSFGKGEAMTYSGRRHH